MTAKGLILRCFIKKQADLSWVAVCIDLNLAIQSEGEADAKKKLEEAIFSYVNEALTVDREYSEQLLLRRAPPAIMAEYYFAWLISRPFFSKVKSALSLSLRSFSECPPLRLA